MALPDPLKRPQGRMKMPTPEVGTPHFNWRIIHTPIILLTEHDVEHNMPPCRSSNTAHSTKIYSRDAATSHLKITSAGPLNSLSYQTAPSPDNDHVPLSSSTIHPASLVAASHHSPALLQLLEAKLSGSLIEYIVGCVLETVDYALGRCSPQSSNRRPELAHFTTFVTNVLRNADVTSPVVLVMLVYIDRIKPHLHVEYDNWAFERVFLGALIVASKFLNDCTLKNSHWALCTGLFGVRDISRIEREFLDVLDWETRVTEEELNETCLPLVVVPHIMVVPHIRRPAGVPLRSGFSGKSNCSLTADVHPTAEIDRSPQSLASSPESFSLPPAPSWGIPISISSNTSPILQIPIHDLSPTPSQDSSLSSLESPITISPKNLELGLTHHSSLQPVCTIESDVQFDFKPQTYTLESCPDSFFSAAF